MAGTIAEFGNGSGYIYEQKIGGSVEPFVNNAANAVNLWKRAYASQPQRKKKYVATGTFINPDQFYDPTWGSRFYIDTAATEPGIVLSGATEITNDLVPNGGNYIKAETLATGILTTARHCPFMFVTLTPQTGTEDDFITINDDQLASGEAIGFVQGDIIVITLDDDTDKITIIDAGSVGGDNLYLRNAQNMVLTGQGAAIAFRRLTVSAGWEEIWRSGSEMLQVLTVTLDADGGTYNAITDPSNFATQSRVVINVDGGGLTLTGAWEITADGKPGQEFEVRMSDGCRFSGAGELTIFGIEINEFLAKNASFVVKAWYDLETEAYLANIVLTEFDEDAADLDGGIATRNGTNTSASTATAKKAISGAKDSFGLVEYLGTVTMAVTLAYDATPKALFSALAEMWKPRGSKRFICEVTTAGAEATKLCVVEVVYTGGIQVYAISGYNLAVGDIIDLSNIMYVAYETPAP